jgi:ribosomal protein S27E
MVRRKEVTCVTCGASLILGGGGVVAPKFLLTY